MTTATSISLDDTRPGTRARSRRGVVGQLLGVPLRWKLVLANLGLVGLAAAVAVSVHSLPAALSLVALTFIASVALSWVLVTLALRPLRDLERTASRVWQGDLRARVTPSRLADRDMIRVDSTFNLLLDGLMDDRDRMRRLAAQVISAQDQERARIARELHDSTAQMLAAAMYQLTAAARLAEHEGATEISGSLADLRQLLSNTVDEVRTLSHTIHPRVLDDLGLRAALEWLARQTREQSDEGPAVEVEVDCAGPCDVPRAPASVLYRVAQESLRNALQHARARTIRLHLESDGDHAALTVTDDGAGFDVREAESRRPGMGLFSIRERVALVNGSVDIHSKPGEGTRIVATVPVSPARTT